MSVRRGLLLLLAFATLAVAAVHLRAEETRLAARIQQLRRERTALRRQSWALQMEIARLRAPRQIRERVDRWCLDVRAPRLGGDALTDSGYDLAVRTPLE